MCQRQLRSRGGAEPAGAQPRLHLHGRVWAQQRHDNAHVVGGQLWEDQERCGVCHGSESVNRAQCLEASQATLKVTSLCTFMRSEHQALHTAAEEEEKDCQEEGGHGRLHSPRV